MRSLSLSLAVFALAAASPRPRTPASNNTRETRPSFTGTLPAADSRDTQSIADAGSRSPFRSKPRGEPDLEQDDQYSSVADEWGWNFETVPEGSGYGVDVYVLDGGIRTTHEYLNRYTPPYKWPKEYDHDYENVIHGTAVAGAVSRMAPWAQILDVNAIYAPNKAKAEAIADITRIHNINKIHPPAGYPFKGSVINCSWMQVGVDPKDFEQVFDAVSEAVAAGVVVVVAAGNRGEPYATALLCHIRGVLCIGAYTKQLTIKKNSNYNDGVDFLAPGEAVWTASSENDHKIVNKSGTSIATGVSSGAAAWFLWAVDGLADDAHAVKHALISYGLGGQLDLPEGVGPNLILNTDLVSLMED